MRQFLILLTLNIILVLIQVSFLPNLLPDYLIPNFVLCLGIAFYLFAKENYAYLSLFMGGLVLDLLGFRIVGETSLVLSCSLFLFSLLRRYAVKNIAIDIVGVLALNFVYIFVFFGLHDLHFFDYIANGVLAYFFVRLFMLIISSYYSSVQKSNYIVRS